MSAMKKNRVWITLLFLFALICLIAGNWRFSSIPVDLEMEMADGDKVQIALALPEKAWVGEDAVAEVKFTFSSSPQVQSAHLLVKMEIEGAEVNPRGEIQTVFNPIQPADVQLKIKPTRDGNLDGSLWIYAGEGEGDLETLLARPVQIKSVTLLGITPLWWRSAGILLLMATIFLLFVAPALDKVRHKTASHGDDQG